MTLDDRLRSAGDDLRRPSAKNPDAGALVRSRHRGRVVMGIVGALALVLAGVVVRDSLRDEPTTNVATPSETELEAELEQRLLTEDDLGTGWARSDVEPTPASADTCGIGDVDVRLEPLASVGRQFARADMSMVLGERLNRFNTREQAEQAIETLEQAFRDCDSFETENPDGGTTSATLAPLVLDIPATFAMTGDFVITDAQGATSTASAFWAATQRDSYLAIVFAVTFTGPESSATSIERWMNKAIDRLRA